MSDSSRHSLFAVAETTFGVTPDTPAFKTVRHTAAKLGLTKGTMMSEELRADRQIKDYRHSNKQVGGEISAELSYGGQLDDFFEAVLCGTWAAKAAPVVGTGISAASSDNSINFAANDAPAVEAGDKISIAGFTGTVGNNRASTTVVSRTAAKIVISGGAALVDDPAGEEVTVTTLTDRLKAGITRRSFSVLRHFTDQLEADEPYHLFTGVELNTLGMTIGVESIVTANFGTVGKNQAAPSGTAPTDATFAAASTTEVIDSFTGSIKEAETAIATITELTLNLENGITPRFTVGSDVVQLAASIGRSNLSGQVTAYFENSTLLKKFINQTESSIDLTLADGAGNKIRLLVPRIKYNGGQPDTEGQGPITLAMPFQALYDTTNASQLVIDRIAA